MNIGLRQYQVLKHLVTNGPKSSGEFQHLPVLRNTVFSILSGLQTRNMVSSAFSEPVRKRGGKAKRIFEVEEEGRYAVQKFEEEFTDLT